ncbi:T9SS type A sorting domain-containing protein [Flavobacteriaceae bacterium S356]|uniref:T9SS type A sorting domain-containing protein n=1 Tax=Asprobacillus argus TaxID=3076534 RepID=A0ABU3LGR8_9FLAO|nr:T9SS type A sorting domain-containing protein [Flavobacteriaceae bacterium S356]
MRAYIKKISVFCFALFASTLFSQELIPHEETTPIKNGLIGISSAVSGGWAVVASPQKDAGNRRGVGGVTFYQLTDGQWKVFQHVLPEDASQLGNFGTSVAIDGTTAVISSIGDHQEKLFSGAVYVYNYDFLLGSWTQTIKLKASDLGMGKRYGQSVDIVGDLIVVGSYNADGLAIKSGAGYVYKKVNNVWQEQQKLYTDVGESNDYFGHHVKILNENYIAVGAYNADGAKERSGVVYVFKQTEEGWKQQATLYDVEGESSDLFGYSLTFIPELPDATNTGRFPGILFVGAPGAQHENKKTGSVYLYTEEASGWQLGLELIEPETDHNDHFGVSITANTKGGLFVGANRTNNDLDLNSGRVYYYQTLVGNGTSVSGGVHLSENFIGAYNQFGTHVTSDEENVIIGSPYADINNITNSGGVNFFRISELVDDESNLSGIYSLSQNVPNPSASSTVIQYELKKPGDVKISLFNINGQLISVLIDEYKNFGLYNLNVDSSKYASGVYLYKFEVNDFTATKKMIIGQ